MEYQKCLTKLLGFDFEIQYKPGLENKAAYALFRWEVVRNVLALTVPAAIQLEDIYGEVDRYPQLKAIKEDLRADVSSHPGYTLVQERLMYRGRLVVPRNSSMISLIMRELHDGKLGGHAGVLKTKKGYLSCFVGRK